MSALSQAEANKRITELQSRSLTVGLFLDINTEVSGTGYTRQAMTLTNGVYTAGLGVRTANQGDLTFGPAVGDWAADPDKINWIKVFDTADNAVVWAGQPSVSARISVVDGQPYQIKAGSLGLLYRTYE